MTGLLSTAKNTLTEYKVTSSIKRKDGEKAEMVSQETESAYATTKSKGGSRNRHRSKSSNGKKDRDRNEKEMEQQGWILVDKGSKVKRKPDQYYTELSNAYSSLAEFSADPRPDNAPTSVASLFKLKSTKHRHQRIQCKIKKKLKDATDTDDAIIEQYIDIAEDECTDMAKSNKSNTRRVAIDTAHSKPTKPNPSLLQQSKNLGCMLSAVTRRLVRKITNSNQHPITFTGTSHGGRIQHKEYNSNGHV